MKTISTIIAALVLGACAAPPLTHEGVAESVRSTTSKFDKVVIHTGPEVLIYVPRGMLNDHVRWKVRALTVKGGSMPGGYELITKVWHQDRSWRFYRSASFIGGDMAPVTRVDSTPSCMGGGGYISCSYTETVRVRLAAEQWAQAKASGLDVRFNADQGPSVVVNISQAYATGFDAGINEK